MSKVILEKFCSAYFSQLPENFQHLDLKSFGIDISLYEYQQQALQNALSCIFQYYQDGNGFYTKYLNNGLTEEIQKQINITKKDEHDEVFNILSQFYTPANDTIEFKQQINRASFWMATGSGKTLVMIKLIELLFELSKLPKEQGGIPANDILILAPKENILQQIKNHIETFNKNGNLLIELRDLRDFERIKNERNNLYSENQLTVFYYRADNITDMDKTEQVSYKTYLNNGNWYVILDEAHKGDSEFSKRQQYYSVLSQNGFLFNFSATFTDPIDIATTVFNFNLKRFIEEGYGKHIKISNEEFSDFKAEKKNKIVVNEFTDVEKQKIVLKSFITLTAVKKTGVSLKKLNPALYHNPLLLTIANSVNTEDADLKLFFRELAIIGKGDYDIEQAKDELLQDFNSFPKFQFEADEELRSKFLSEVKGVTAKDITKFVFNANKPGSIEISKIPGNNTELAFKLSTSHTHFALLKVGDASAWEKTELEDYEFSKTPVTKSFFDEINTLRSEINILLGSRIFYEGWDSNRPNVINFINIGTNEEAQKFVLQATGRGVRIEPLQYLRKRFKRLYNEDILPSSITQEQVSEILTENSPIETLFIFATNKEVITNIINGLNQNKTDEDWYLVQGITKVEIAKDLLVPKYKDAPSATLQQKFRVASQDFETLVSYIKPPNDKLVLVENDIKVSTLSKIHIKANLEIKGAEKNEHPLNLLFALDAHYSKVPKLLSHFEALTTEIEHFHKMEVKNLTPSEISQLQDEIKKAIEGRLTAKELMKLVKEGKITEEEFEEQLKAGSKNEFKKNGFKISLKKIEKHYYNPLLIGEEGLKDYLRRIIHYQSEADFINALENYLKQTDNKLKKYEWWYFSKLDESADHINIPYFNSADQKYHFFYPDFIFWLKTKSAFHIIFVDPKGTEIPRNAVDKLKGYNEIFTKQLSFKGTPVKTKLWFYNEREPTDLKDDLQNVWTNEMGKIFS